jgi:hypothetical protein
MLISTTTKRITSKPNVLYNFRIQSKAQQQFTKASKLYSRNKMTITGPLADFIERNKKHQETLQTPPNMQQMSKRAQELGTGVFIITCSDPRLNPYRILGLDDQNQEMREFD